jgi:uncharacterized protein YeaO (DUF488 family)
MGSAALHTRRSGGGSSGAGGAQCAVPDVLDEGRRFALWTTSAILLVEVSVLYTANRFDATAHRGAVVDVSRTARSVFAPSAALLGDYKAGRCAWPQYERRYRDELRALWRRDRQVFLDLIAQAAAGDVTLTCWERGDEDTVQCLRRLLADILCTIARAQRICIEPDVDDLEYLAITGRSLDEDTTPVVPPGPQHEYDRKRHH